MGLTEHRVNNKPLPEKHGFPLPPVAEGSVRSQWIIFVDKIEAVVHMSDPARPQDEAKPGEPAFIPLQSRYRVIDHHLRSRYYVFCASIIIGTSFEAFDPICRIDGKRK